MKGRSAGFSGNRNGMTSSQIYKVESLLDDDITTQISRHGDCVGSDADFHKTSRLQGLWIVGYPPIKDTLRAFCDFDEVREPKDYLVRNRDIVDDADWMIFTPEGFKEVLRSGTWSTYRYCKEQLVPGFIVFPDGSVTNVLDN